MKVLAVRSLPVSDVMEYHRSEVVPGRLLGVERVSYQ